MLEKNTSWVTRPALNARSRNSAGSSSGAPPRRLRRRWWTAKRPSVIGAAPRHSHVHAGQPCWRPSTSGRTMSTRPRVISAVPTRSRRLAPSTRDSGTARAAMARAIEADGHVDEKAAAPAQAGDVGLHEDAADELPADRGQPEDDAVDADRAHAIGTVVDDADDRQDLRAEQRGGEALDETRDDEHGRARSQAAGRGRQREEGEAEREHAPAAELVAEAPGGDEEGGEGQAVAGDDPLDRAGAGVQIALHRGHGDVDDEEVQDDHEGAREDDGEGGPLMRQQAGGPRETGCEFVCAHDAHDGASAPRARRLPAR